VKRCPSCGDENADKARFCQNCATPLAGSDGSLADVRRVVTIVFADVTGSTSLGERLDPEALRRVMGRYFDEMSAVIERHGGTVEKFIGDAVMAVFGIPRLHEDDAVRAVRAAAGMREALEALNLELEREHGVGIAARVGVNTGEVVAGDPSAGQRLVTGDAVNVAARLEQAASPGEISIGGSTYRLVKDAVGVEEVAALDLKGKEEPVPAYRLIEVLADVAGHERHLDSPMVGRSKELEMLERALEHAISERTSHLFTLLGSAGVGKSRLVREFLDGSVGTATVLRGRCLSYGEGITFFPLAEVVHQAAGILEGEPPSAAGAKLDALLTEVHDGERISALVGGLFGWSPPGATEDAFWAVRKVLEHLARERPVVVVFDDIHWAEPTMLDLIEHVADWTRDAAVLVVCLARPELLDIRTGWGGGKMNASSILLEPLPSDEASLLVDNLLGRADIPQAARERILEAAEGNPLFVEEMLAMLIDDGFLRFEDGGWRSVEDLAHVTVPPTIHLLLAARLDRLDAEERAVIERGAVEGKVFHTGAVTTLSPDSVRPNVRSRLLALARKELIRPDRAEFAGEDAFRFRHLLIRDAAYHAMPKEQRADLHERFAGWLTDAAGELIGEYEEILGHHLEQAYRYRAELGVVDDRARDLAGGAARHLYASAVRADEREDLPSARTLLERCAALADGRLAVQALVLLAQVLEELAEYPVAFEAASRAASLAERQGERRLGLRARLILAMTAGNVDPSHTMAMARAAVESVLDEALALGEEPAADSARLMLARLAFFLGEVAKGFEILDELAKRAHAMTRRDRQEIAAQLCVSAYFGTLPVDEALAVIDRARDLRGDSLSGEAHDLRVRAGLLAMTGRNDEAEEAVGRSDRMFRELGIPERRVAASQIVGEFYRLAGWLDRAEALFREMHDAYEVMGETGFNSTISALLAQTLCDLGRFDEAESFASKSRELSAEDDLASQSEWRLAQARVLAHRGAFDDALGLADEALAISATTEYLDWYGQAHETRGEILQGAGRGDDARAAFEEALDRFERKGNVPAAARLRARLEDL
jgi:class 3 adenylate cyclase/tetratricopeptide (TPR) repeat protein